jgi:hypothetical protein
VSQTITAGQTVQFTGQGQDQYNNNILGLSYVWTNANSSGLFNNTTSGTYLVKASSGGVNSADVQVTVNPAAFDHLAATLNKSKLMSISVNYVELTAKAMDLYGNGILGRNVTLSGFRVGDSPSATSGVTDAKGEFKVTVKSTVTGSVGVTADSGGLVASAALDVIKGADLYADNVINYKDLAILASYWGLLGANYLADMNCDGVVNHKDLAILASYWGS